jgi:hypothetical protein
MGFLKRTFLLTYQFGNIGKEFLFKNCLSRIYGQRLVEIIFRRIPSIDRSVCARGSVVVGWNRVEQGGTGWNRMEQDGVPPVGLLQEVKV